MELYSDKKECCGCGACYNSCPCKAITMKEDFCGFVYPSINQDICIECGICVRACSYKVRAAKESGWKQRAYAAMAKHDETLSKAASGGVVYELAKEIIHSGGIVFGCVLEYENEMLVPKHIGTEKETELRRMQGSKYVQSSIGTCYQEALTHLKKGRTVLFTGTPCQIDGLYGFLQGHMYSNLYTADIICHGVPNARFFHAYVEHLQKKLGGRITDVKFRDKTQGWGLHGSVYYKDKRGIVRRKRMPLQGFSYYKFFLDSVIYRENCYSCKYANCQRTSDLTLGDYWGIEEAHPELLTSNGENWDIEKGVSCVIVNSEKGAELLAKISQQLKLKESTIEKVSKNNRQLERPASKPQNREMILNLFEKEGYAALEKKYYRNFGIKGLLYTIWNYVPGSRVFSKIDVERKNN